MAEYTLRQLLAEAGCTVSLSVMMYHLLIRLVSPLS